MFLQNVDAPMYTVKALSQQRKISVHIETTSETPYYIISHIGTHFWHSFRLFASAYIHVSSAHNSSYWWLNDILTRQKYPSSQSASAIFCYWGHSYKQEHIRGRSVQTWFIENQTAPPLRHIMTFIDTSACMSDILIDDGWITGPWSQQEVFARQSISVRCRGMYV